MIDWLNSTFVAILNWIYSWVGNYGWSVVVFTLMIRLLVLPLEFNSRKGMRDMQRIQPKVAELQKKYANDKEKLNKKTMELYTKEKVKPTAGCLPLLLSMPILFIMFTAMRVVANEQTIQMILNLRDGVPVTMESWLWIKNVFQPDSPTATILPAVGDQLMAISKVNYSSILTQENIDAARAFLASPEYAAIAAEYGANQFMILPLNFLIMKFDILIPASFQALMQYANGLFILPILAGVTQYLMTVFQNGRMSEEQKKAQENSPANSGFMKWFFPIFSVWICSTSNSAFSIYWFAVNVFMIIQNFALNYYFDRQDAKLALSKSE